MTALSSRSRLAPVFLAPVLLSACLLLPACGSSPAAHYYSLSRAPDAGQEEAGQDGKSRSRDTPARDTPARDNSSGQARMTVEVLPVTVPESVNRNELVLTDRQGRVSLQDNDLWIAPLPDALRQLLAEALWQDNQALDSYQAPVPGAASTVPQYRLSLRLERFEAVTGGPATVTGAWTVRPLPSGPALSCRLSVTVPAVSSSAAYSSSGVESPEEKAAAALARGSRQLVQAVAASLGRLERKEARPCQENSLP